MKKILKVFLLILIFITGTSGIFAQRTITGKVIDTDKQSVAGANVVVKGTNIGAITDADGRYTINVPSSVSIIVFSFIGHVTKEVDAGNNAVLDVTLETEATALQEVVVVGYGTQKKKDLSGSVASVKTDDLRNTPAASMEQGLVGLAAGVQVVQNAIPGSIGTVRIRGVSTTGNNDPLWIIDGIAGSPNNLNPGDIESMDVLKDASAAAIYGSRAANGVIIVTTKRGTTGKTKVVLDAYTGFQHIWKKISMCNSAEFATLANLAYTNSGMTPNPAWANPSSLTNTDWQDAVTQNGFIQNYNLDISGGTEKLKAALILNYNTTDGSIIVSKNDRYSIRLNTDYEVSDRLKFGSNLQFSNSSTVGIPINDGSTGVLNMAVQMWPDQPVYNTDGSYNILLTSANGLYYPRQFSNPVARLELPQTKYTAFSQRFLGTVFGEAELIKGLKFKSTFGLDYGTGSSRNFTPTYITDPANILNNTTNSLSWGMNNTVTYTAINTLTYSNIFGKHNITALVGTEAIHGNAYNMNTSSQNTPNNLEVPDAALASRGNGSGSEFAYLSYFGRVNYIYADKYILQVNIRADGSYKLPSADRWGYFPSASLAWRISKENFMKSISFINDLKIRASYGSSGNQNSIGYGGTTNFPYLSLYGSPYGGSYTFGTGKASVPTIVATSMGVSNLKWETQNMSDLGLDGTLLNNKITITADYYSKTTDGLLLQVPIPATVGAPPPQSYNSVYSGYYIIQNAGKVKNSGYELALSYNDNAGDFKYNLGANITTVKNEVLSLGAGQPLQSTFYLTMQTFGSTLTQVGHSIGEFYGYVTDGIFQNQAEINSSPTQAGAVPGDRKYKDINGDGVIDSKDQTYIGSPIPKFFYGFNLGASYKGFDLSVIIQGEYGNKIYNELKGQLYNIHNFNGNGVGNVAIEMVNSWTGEGTSNTLPRVAYNTNTANYIGSDFYVEDGSYIRCRTLQVGYTLPSSLVSHAKLGSVRIYLNTQNLFTITKYSGFDPEISNLNPLTSGVDWGQYPVSRVYTVGVNVQF